jgi:hypothetical protein
MKRPIRKTQTAKGPRRVVRVFLGASLLFAVLTSVWAIATPIAAAPDEPAHLIKAASVVRGQFIGEGTVEGHIVQVPRYVAFTGTQAACYAFKSEVSAACIPPLSGDATSLVSAATTAGLYNPVYYLMVGWPTLITDDSNGTYLMRLASALPISLLLGVSVALVSTWRRPTIPLLGTAAAVTPMVLYLGGTVNPNSMEIAAILATFVAMMTIVSRHRRVSLGALAAIVTVSAAIAGNTRGLSLLWVAIAIIAPLLLLRGPELVALLRTRAVILAIIGTAVSSAFALFWVLGTSSLTAGIDPEGEVPRARGAGTSSVEGFFDMLERTFDYGQGSVGLFGWVDTPAPLFVGFVWSILVGGLLLAALVTLRGRALIMTCGTMLALLLTPPIIQSFYVTEGGFIWQGRYTLPLVVIAVMAASLCISEAVTIAPRVRRRFVIVVMAVWATAQFDAFATTLRRYFVGLDVGWEGLVAPEWAPPGGIALSLTAFAVALVAAVVGVVLADRPAPAEQELAGADLDGPRGRAAIS